MGKSIKEKLRQIIAAAAAAAAVAAVTAVPSMAEEQVKVTGIPAEGYEFVDIAYDGNGTLVALAKDSAYEDFELYCSTDRGLKWGLPENTPNSGGSAIISSNKSSQQQLVWWEAKKTFLLHTAVATYESSNGINWIKSGLTWSSASILSVSGDYLLHAANNKARAAKDTETMDDLSNPIFEVNGSNYYGKTIAAKPEENGKIEAIVSYLDRIDALELDTYSLKWTSKGFQSRESLPNNPNDMIYVSGADQYLFVDGSNDLHTARPDSSAINYIAVTVKDDANVTGVNANDSYIVVGMSDGTMYYTPNAAITSTTEWKQVDSMNAGQAIKNIEFISDTEFVALGTTGIYKGKLFEETQQPTEPEVTQPSFGATETSNDDFWAKTATFTLTPKGNTNINVKVSVNGQEQTKKIENIEAEIKFGIIVIGDDETAVDEARVSASASVE